MSKFWAERTRTKCPFYIGEREKSIVCEGIVSNEVINKFATPKEKMNYKKYHCYCENGAGCPVYDQKYQEYELKGWIKDER